MFLGTLLGAHGTLLDPPGTPWNPPGRVLGRSWWLQRCVSLKSRNLSTVARFWWFLRPPGPLQGASKGLQPWRPLGRLLGRRKVVLGGSWVASSRPKRAWLQAGLRKPAEPSGTRRHSPGTERNPPGAYWNRTELTRTCRNSPEPSSTHENPQQPICISRAVGP